MVVKISVFTSPTCPHCPSAVRLAEEISKEDNDVLVEELSSATPKGQKLAKKHDVMSVPTIIVKGDGHPDNIGFRGTPLKKSLIKGINIAKGIEDFEENKKEKNSSKTRVKEFFDRLLDKIHKRFKLRIKL